MSATMTAAIVGTAVGVNSLTGGGVSKALGFGGSPSSSQAQNATDPFAPYRAGEAQQYNDAMQSGGTMDLTKMPGYSQWMSGVFNPAQEGLKSQMAASGMAGSGAELSALQTQGQQGYYGFMTDYMNRLAQGSGAINNPASGGSAFMNQGNMNANNSAAGLGMLATSLKGFAGTNSPVNTGMPAMSSSDSQALYSDYGYTGTNTDYMPSYQDTIQQMPTPNYQLG